MTELSMFAFGSAFRALRKSRKSSGIIEPVPGVKLRLSPLRRPLLGTGLILASFGVQAAAVLTSLYSFKDFPLDGQYPLSGLTQGSHGNLYGTTTGGGEGDAGTVFKITPDGLLTTLYSFTGGDDGASPNGLVQGSDGNLYGTTMGGGGEAGAGTVFKITANGVLTTLHSFTGGNDGASPSGSLAAGRDGNFYGTTSSAGLNGGGTVFEISPSGSYTIIYSFTGGNDGYSPGGGLVQGDDGSFYGTTDGGGTHGYGTVFQFSTNTVLTTLYAFFGGTDGGSPNGLVQGGDGNFYGTTDGGDFSKGTVFKISTTGAYTRLHLFTGGADGGNPAAALVQSPDGGFYGTTSDYDPQHHEFYGNGTIFKIGTNGALNTVYSFTGGDDGANPFAPLAVGTNGNFYGTAFQGGAHSDGTTFQISTNGVLASLHSFGSFLDGESPEARLVQSSDGSFYGTTVYGGLYGVGTAFRISADGTYVSLYAFTSGEDGYNPSAAMVQGSDGNLYGTTTGGGEGDAGTVFKITPDGLLTTLYSFTGGDDGASPNGLVQGSDGIFYGTTSGGGYGDMGSVFKIGADGAFTSLYVFKEAFAAGPAYDGGNPITGLVQGSDGLFYGVTSRYGTNGGGTVFRISTKGALATLYSFTQPISAPNSLLQGGDGNFYGTADYGSGTVFKFSTNQVLTTLGSFATGGGNLSPNGLAQATDGDFYGTTSYGGSHNFGTVFKISPNGALTSLYSFTNGIDGSKPFAGLVQGRDGKLYGTTSGGGLYGQGTVFRLDVGLGPYVKYSANPTNGSIPLTVQFTSAGVDSEGNSIAQWNWSFGDGSISTAQSPSHVFTNAGIFLPHLAATNSLGLPVLGSGPSVTASLPIAQYAANPTHGSLPLMVQFTSAGVDSGGNSITQWNWSFGDGSISTAQSPSHVYATAGTFFPSLFATNDLGVTVVGAGPSTISTYHEVSSVIAAWGDNSSGQTNVPPSLSNAVAVAAGLAHSLALRADGTVAAWGDNSYGETTVPAGLSGVVAVSAGGGFSLALLANGTVVAWGDNSYGQTNVPTGLTNVVAVAAGGDGSLALRADGTIVAWGYSASKVLSVPAGLTNVVAVSTCRLTGGASYGLALRADGTVTAWGDNFYGQTNVPAGLSNVVAVSAGGTCAEADCTALGLALRADGTVAAWGQNIFGQTNVPADLSNVVAVSAGGRHSLSLRADGTVAAWGDNSLGQTSVPAGLSNLVAVAAGDQHSLALSMAGRLAPFRFGGTGGSLSVSDGAFNVGLTGTVGASYVLETSFNLTDWTPMQTNNMPLGGLFLSVRIGTNRSQFLRARIAQP